MKLEAIARLDNQQMLAGLNQIMQRASGAGSAIVRHLGSVAALAGVSLSIGGIAAEIGRVIERGSELNILAIRTGQTAEAMLKLERAGKVAGLGAETMAMMVNRLQAALAGVNEMGEHTEHTFQRLGLDVNKLRTMTAAQQMQALQTALAKVSNQADKVQILRNLFGREGAALLPVFAGGDMGAPLSAGAALLAKNAETFHKVSVALGRAGEVVKGFFFGIADRVATVLLPLLDRFNKMDFSKWGQQIGGVIALLVDAFKEGKLGDLVGLALKVGFMEATNFLAGALAGVATMAAGMFGPVLMTSFRFLTDGSLWTGLADGLEWAVAKFAAAFLACFQEPLSHISAAFEVIAHTFAGWIVWSWNQLASTAAGKWMGMKQLEVKGDKTYEEYRQDYLKGSKATVGAFKGTAAEDAPAAKSELSAAVNARMAEVAAIIQKAMKDFSEGRGNLQIFGASLEEARTKLAALAAGIKTAPDKTSAENVAAGGTGLLAKIAGVKETDSLSRAGLFMSRTSSASSDYARNTARNTSDMVRLMREILSRQGAGDAFLNA